MIANVAAAVLIVAAQVAAIWLAANYVPERPHGQGWTR